MLKGGDILLSKSELEKLSQININEVDTTKLKDLADIYIQVSKPIEERIETFFSQIENPYCFLVNGTPVKISFANHKKTLNESLYNYFHTKKMQRM